MNTFLLAQISAGGVIHILVYLLIAACIIGLIYYIATLVFPTAANIIRVICLVAFLIIVLLLLLPILGVA
jgi:hypothetical protein